MKILKTAGVASLALLLASPAAFALKENQGKKKSGKKASQTVNQRLDVIDVNNNGVIERSEWRGNMDVFDRIDRNDNGVITRQELRTALGNRNNRNRNNNDRDREGNRFRGLDRNGDGIVTRGEWRGNNRSFDNQDRNNDGILTGSELRGLGRSGDDDDDDDR